MEVLLIVAILSLVAIVSGVGFRSSLNRARSAHSIDSWLIADDQTRALSAKTSGEFLLKLDSRKGTLTREQTGEEASELPQRVDRNFQLAVIDREAGVARPTSQLAYGASGQTDDYLIRSGRFVVVVGATGQRVEVKSEEEAIAFLKERAVAD